MIVTLNGNRYHLKAGTGVKRTPLNEWAENIRFDGTQKRKDKRLISTWAFDDWSGGLGVERMNLDKPEHRNRLWDVDNVDTRWTSHLIFPPALVTPSISPSYSMNYIFEYMGNAYFAGRAVPSNNNIAEQIAFQFVPGVGLNMIGSVSQFVASTGSLGVGWNANILGIIPDGERLTLAYNGYIVNIPSLGEYTRTASYGGAAFSNSKYATYSVQGGASGVSTQHPVEMFDLGGTLHVLAYTNDRRAHMLFPILGTPGSYAGGGTINTQIGTYLAPLVSDGAMVYAALPNGVYRFKESPDVIVDTSQAQDPNCNITVYNGNLHVKNKTSLIQYDGADVTNVGYDRDDGLPIDKMGEITAMTSSMQWIFAAVKGGTYSHILTKDAKHAWQYYAKVPTPGIWIERMKLSSMPDGIQRLWCIFGNNGNPGYFPYPLTNPLQLNGYLWNVGSGYITLPVFDGGVIEDATGYYDIAISGRTRNSVNSIKALYGIDGAGPDASLGVLQSAGAFSNEVGTFPINAPYGTVGKLIQLKFVLSKDTAGAGTTPYLDSMVLHYLKVPKTRELFEFDVDIQKTQNSEYRTYEAIIGSLDYERNSVALVPFVYGQIATRKVRILEEPFEENIQTQDYYEGEREGIVHLRCFEVI